MRTLTTVAAVAALIAGPAGAHASYPVASDLVTTSAGRDVVAYSLYPEKVSVVAAEQADGRYAVTSRTRPPATSYATSQSFSLAGGDEVVAAYQDVQSGDNGRGSYSYSVGGALFAGSPGAALGPGVRVLPSFPESEGAALSANRRGDAALLVDGELRHYVLMRPAGGRFRRPAGSLAKTLLPEELAVDGNGRAIVVGSDDSGLVAVTVERDGRPGPPQQVTREAHDFVRLATGPGGEVAVAWLGSGGALRFARRPRAGARFGRAVTLAQTAQPGSGFRGPQGIVIDGEGRALVVWIDDADGFGPDASSRVRAVAVAPGDRVGEPVSLSAEDGQIPQAPHVATNDRGDVVVAWPQWPRERPSTGRRLIDVVARTGTTAGAFGPPVALDSQERDGGSDIGVSVAPSGRASVLWRDSAADGSDHRLYVSHLGTAGAAPPVEIPWAGSLPPALEERSPPLREARVVTRRARARAGGRVQLRTRCRTWVARGCKGVVRLRRPDGSEAARGRFHVPFNSAAGVSLRLGPAARRSLRRTGSLRVEAVARTRGPRGATRRAAVVLRAGP